MASLRTSILILLAGLILSVPFIATNAMENSASKNQTEVDTGITMRYDSVSNLIVVNYTNRYNDTRRLETSVYSTTLGMGTPIYTNETEIYPAMITYAPIDKGQTYLVVLKSIRDSGNYTYSYSVKPSEEGGVGSLFNLFGG